MISGITYIISYLNLLTLGYSFIEYVNYIIGYIVYFVIGLLLVLISIYIRR